ncbi:hypothetical protein ACHQM5_028426 [Ranunculus cassubicifolius]
MMASKMNESHLKICLLVEHRTTEMSHSLYMFDLPSDLEQKRELDSEGFQVVSPLLLFPESKFLNRTEFINVGSKVFFFGGFSSGHIVYTDKNYATLLKAVHVLDMEKPEQGLRRVASMNACKEDHCAFVDNGMIYTLGRAIKDKSRSKQACFERYIPQADKWEVLPDPPFPLSELSRPDWTGRATVVGREVFIGSYDKYVIFNLDTLEWAKVLPESLAERFPYGALYVDGFLYHIRGGDVWKPSAVWDFRHDLEPLQIVRRGPLPRRGRCGSSSKDILECVCLEPKGTQVVATAAELACGDETLFTHRNFLPWRELLHLGGPYFCYLCTAVNVNDVRGTGDYRTRFVGIMVFKELQGENMNTEFGLLSAFFYRIQTDFFNYGDFIRCCALGAVPESWNEVLPNKTLEIMSRTKDGSKKSETENHDPADVGCLEKLLAAQKEEISRLSSELAKKDLLLKSYEATLKSKDEQGITEI